MLLERLSFLLELTPTESQEAAVLADDGSIWDVDIFDPLQHPLAPQHVHEEQGHGLERHRVPSAPDAVAYQRDLRHRVGFDRGPRGVLVQGVVQAWCFAQALHQRVGALEAKRAALAEQRAERMCAVADQRNVTVMVALQLQVVHGLGPRRRKGVQSLLVEDK
eukprot:scaffold85340_cov69-Phaeocystis_antarctica.AAC.1